jgi:hypothetical protein
MYKTMVTTSPAQESASADPQANVLPRGESMASFVSVVACLPPWWEEKDEHVCAVYSTQCWIRWRMAESIS